MKKICLLTISVFIFINVSAQDDKYFTQPKNDILKKKEQEANKKEEQKRKREELKLSKQITLQKTNRDSLDRMKVFYKKRNNIIGGIGFFNLNSKQLKNYVTETNNTYLYSVWNSKVTFKEVRPIFLKYEIALFRRFSLGFNFSRHQISADYRYKYQDNSNDAMSDSIRNIFEIIKYKATSISIKTNWHFAVGKHFEMYGGPGIGLNIKTIDHSTNFKDSNGNYSSLLDLNTKIFPYSFNQSTKNYNPMFDASLGARLYITKNIGINVETSVAKAILQVGLVIGL